MIILFVGCHVKLVSKFRCSYLCSGKNFRTMFQRMLNDSAVHFFPWLPNPQLATRPPGEIPDFPKWIHCRVSNGLARRLPKRPKRPLGFSLRVCLAEHLYLIFLFLPPALINWLSLSVFCSCSLFPQTLFSTRVFSLSLSFGRNAFCSGC